MALFRNTQLVLLPQGAASNQHASRPGGQHGA